MSKKSIKKEATTFGSVGGTANFNKYGTDGPKGMRARGKKGAQVRWGKKGK